MSLGSRPLVNKIEIMAGHASQTLSTWECVKPGAQYVPTMSVLMDPESFPSHSVYSIIAYLDCHSRGEPRLRTASTRLAVGMSVGAFP